MDIRHSSTRDIPRIMDIYSHARRFMAEHGNPNQWGPTLWPPEDLIRKDILSGNSYVCTDDSGNVIGTFYFVQGRDIEPTYRQIFDGAWLDDSPYGVVHMIPSKHNKPVSVIYYSRSLPPKPGNKGPMFLDRWQDPRTEQYGGSRLPGSSAETVFSRL